MERGRSRDETKRVGDIRFAIANPVDDSPIMLKCPNPNHQDSTPSLAVYPDGTYCFGCHFQEEDYEFLERVDKGGVSLPERGSREARRTVGDPTPTEVKVKVGLFHDILMNQRRHRMSWLHDRGIYKHTIMEYKLGHTGVSFSIPVWCGGEVVGMRYRMDPEYHDEDTLKRFKYLPERGQGALIYDPKGKGNIVVTEGEFDALFLCQLGLRGITSTSGVRSLAKLITPQRLGVSWVFVATDADDEGDAGYEKLCGVWGRKLPRIPLPRGEDVTSALMRVPNVERRDVFLEWMEDAVAASGMEV